MGSVRERAGQLALLLRAGGSTLKAKRTAELGFWQQRQAAEGTLGNAHYERFFTSAFGLDREFYRGRSMLDVGCGPRGSLEWADVAAERVGLDPLADRYRALGTDRHAMRYVSAPAEHIPFPDGHFDVVSSFNSLDHVDDLAATVAELKRVTAAGGTLLLITDVGHRPTVTEPVAFGFEVVDRFAPEFATVDVRRLEKREDGVYASVEAAVPYDDADPTPRYGLLVARLARR